MTPNNLPMKMDENDPKKLTINFEFFGVCKN
jgi:pseudouridine 5'-phosphatase